MAGKTLEQVESEVLEWQQMEEKHWAQFSETSAEIKKRFEKLSVDERDFDYLLMKAFRDILNFLERVEQSAIYFEEGHEKKGMEYLATGATYEKTALKTTLSKLMKVMAAKQRTERQG